MKYSSIIRIFPGALPALIFLAGCGGSISRESAGEPVIILSAGNTIASCPFLTTDAAGRPLMSWLQQDSTAEPASLYYAVSADSGKTFGVPKQIPATSGAEPHGENLPRMVCLPGGTCYAAFGVKKPSPGNPYTGAIYYSASFDYGKTWSSRIPLDDDSSTYDQRYFSLAQLPNGQAGMVWLSNSTPEGSTVYFAQTGGRKGFGKRTVIGRHSCQCCRTDLLVDDSGLLNVAFRDIINDSIRDMVWSFSADMGKTFSKPVRISPDNWVLDGCPHTGPTMAKNKQGLHFAWYTMGGGGGVYYCHTKNKGLSFSSRQAVSSRASARHPQMIALADGSLATVWDETVQAGKVFHSRIGLEIRSPSGLRLLHEYVTADDLDAIFPQVMEVTSKQLLIAFTCRQGKQLRVAYELWKIPG